MNESNKAKKGKEKSKEEFATEKLQTIKKYMSIDIPATNIIFFDYSKESLTEFVEKIERGQAKIKRNI